MTTQFDTLAFVKKLEDAGFTHDQASALTESMTEAVQQAEYVTRDYLRAAVAELKTDLTRLLFGVAVGQIALTVSLVKLL